MITIIKKILPFTIIIGTLLVGFGIATLNGVSIVEQHTINYTAQYSWNYYTINLSKYLQNLQTSIKPQQLTEMLPNMPTTINLGNNLAKNIANSLIFVLNWLIYITNWLILAPIKIIMYPFNILLAIFGINTSDQALIEAFIKIYNLAIPLIPYI